MKDEALALASSNGHVEMVNRLLTLGADPNRDPHLSPLLRSLFYAHDNVTATLLAHGASPNVGAIDELTLAAIGSGLVGVSWTVDSDTSTQNATQESGTSTSQAPAPQIRSTSLIALLNRDMPLTELLSRSSDSLLSPVGTEPSASTRSSTPVGTSISAEPRLTGCKGLVQVLDELGDAEGLLNATKSPLLRHYDAPPLAVALLTQSIPNVTLLLEQGADPNRLALDRYTPLYLAGIDCNVDAARALIAHGADPLAGPPEYQVGGSEPGITFQTGTTSAKPELQVCPEVTALVAR